MAITSSTWKIPPRNELYWNSWDDEVIVYNNWSGDTHLLNSIAIEILNYFQQNGVCSSIAVTEYVSQFVNLDEDTGDLRLLIDEHISQLDKLGLIERTKS
jgi:PqqD family protein of HPr-rel-A system